MLFRGLKLLEVSGMGMRGVCMHGRRGVSSGGSFRGVMDELSTGEKFYNLSRLNDSRVKTLPYSIRVLLESMLRNSGKYGVEDMHVERVLSWTKSQHLSVEVPFLPGRVILQDFTGVPLVADLAAMRDAMALEGGDVSKINPLVPVDLVIDHSVQVDFARTSDSQSRNEAIEMTRNVERYEFLKWGAQAFKNFRIIPPGSGIVHQVNLEYLAHVVMEKPLKDGTKLLYPDSVVGTDSHTTMIGGLSILGWGVGGIEAEAVMLSQPISMVLPQVVGVYISGELNQTTTATDLVLYVTEILRKEINVVGKFVEFFGPGVQNLSVADRATLANMAPEYGATIGYFAPDQLTYDYMHETGRKASDIKRVEEYYTKSGFDGHYKSVEFSDVVKVDLNTIVPSIAGPKRPQDRIPLTNVRNDFEKSLINEKGFKGFAINPQNLYKKSQFILNGKNEVLQHGSVVIAAITSCTNTSNPGVMLASALLAKNALEKGLTVPSYVKTSLSPGSKAVTEYLNKSGLNIYLEKLGFFHAGYGCMTCIGNSGKLSDEISQAIVSESAGSDGIVAVAVLSGNRNFEGRVHPLTKANYLASPPLVVAYALAGRVNIDFETEELGNGVFLRDIWPSRKDIALLEKKFVGSDTYDVVYKAQKGGKIANTLKGSQAWQNLPSPTGLNFPWNSKSTYIRQPPFFKDFSKSGKILEKIENARVLLLLGDSVTTDHISPAGNISADSCAADYLKDRGNTVSDFNTYGSRRGNDEVMVRGTFANIRLTNFMCPKEGPKTIHQPSGKLMRVFDASETYRQENVPVVIVAGSEYGCGSSRDWAAKGPKLLGVRAVIAKSFERIHRSNLAQMDILPLQFQDGQDAASLFLDGSEMLTVQIDPFAIQVAQTVHIRVDKPGTKPWTFPTTLRLDVPSEIEYVNNQGILQYVFRNMLN